MESGYPTEDEVFDCLVSFVNLKIWFIWRWLSEHPDEEFKYVFKNRVDILRKTVFNSGCLTVRDLKVGLSPFFSWDSCQNQLTGI